MVHHAGVVVFVALHALAITLDTRTTTTNASLWVGNCSLDSPWVHKATSGWVSRPPDCTSPVSILVRSGEPVERSVFVYRIGDDLVQGFLSPSQGTLDVFQNRKHAVSVALSDDAGWYHVRWVMNGTALVLNEELVSDSLHGDPVDCWVGSVGMAVVPLNPPVGKFIGWRSVGQRGRIHNAIVGNTRFHPDWTTSTDNPHLVSRTLSIESLINCISEWWIDTDTACATIPVTQEPPAQSPFPCSVSHSRF